MSNKKKLIINYIIGFSVLFLPLLITVCVKWKSFFTKQNGVSITLGAILALGIAVLCLSKKTSLFKGFVGETIVLILCWCFNSILDNFLLLYFMFWIGDLFYRLLFQTRIAHLEEMCKVDREMKTKDPYIEKQQETLINKLADRFKGSV